MRQSSDSSGSEIQFGSALTGNAFVSAMRALPVSVAHTDRELRYTWIYNPHRSETLDAAIGRRLIDVVPSEGSQQVSELKRKVLETGQRIQLDFEGDHEYGTHHYHISIDPLYEGTEIVGVSTVTMDLTPTLRAQASLRESEERFSKAFKVSPHALAISNSEGRFVEINDAFEQIFGFSRSETIGKTSEEFPIYADREERDRVRAAFLSEGRLRDMEVRLLTKDGQDVIGTISAERIDIDGISFSLAIFRDVTDRKRAEEALRRSEQELRLITNSVPVLISYVDAGERIRFANAAHARFYRRTAEGVVGMPLRELVGDDAYSVIRGHVDSALKGRHVSFEAELPTETNGVRLVRARFTPDVADGGDVEGFYAVIDDVTELQRAEEARREVEMRAEAILETTVDAVVTIDSSGSIQSFNRAAERLFGYEPEEVIGKNVKVLMPPPWSDEHDDYLENYRRTGVKKIIGTGREVEARRKDGTTFPIELAVSEVDLGDRRIFTGLIRDISERKAAEQALRHREAELRAVNEDLERRVQERTVDLLRANLELEERNRELQSFAYVASHDMQEPLRKIQTFADLVRDEFELPNEAGALLQRLQSSASRMSQVLADLLAFSRITARPDPFSEVDLRKVIEEVLDDLQLADGMEGASIDVDADVTLTANESQLRQLINHLVMNALKYRRPDEPSHVRIAADVKDIDGVPSCVIEVTDNGIGFDMRYAEKIFEPFERLHERGAYAGTGMGLAICRRIVHRHGGTISAEGKPGQGSRFTALIPISQQEVGPRESDGQAAVEESRRSQRPDLNR